MSRFESTVNSFARPVMNHEFGVSVTLNRGASVTAAFTARRGDKVHEAIGQEFGLEVKMTMRDFWLPVESLVLDGDTVEPRTGDRITEGSETFEIQPPDDKKPSVQLQTGGYEYLVHTKRIQ